MSSSKQGTAVANKQLAAENKAALKVKFPKAKLLKQFAEMATATGSEAEAADAKRKTAYIVCQAARQYRQDAYGTKTGQTNDVSTILDAWRAHWRGLIKELHAKESPFVEMGEANKKGEQKPVMTGYGRNVASTARGVIEFDVPVVDSEGVAVAYTEMTKAITQERRASLPQERRALNTAKDELADALAAIRKNIGTSTEAIALFAGIIGYCHEAMQDHGADGLAAISLALDDTDLTEFLTVELETETESESDDTALYSAENEGLAEEVILQTG